MKKSLLFCGVAALVFASCTQNEVLDVNENRAIGFDAFVGKPTKAVTDLNGTSLSKFNVFGDFDGGASIVFDNTVVTASGTGDLTGKTWTPEDQAYWTLNKTYEFGAYSNGNNALTKDQVSFNNGTLTISGYEVNDANDLIAATAQVECKSGDETVDLSFKHLLSKIKFTFSTTAVPTAYKLEVTSITFDGIKTDAGCTFASNAIVTGWSGTNGTYTVPTLGDYAVEGGEATTQDILVIPQANNTITATITVKMIDEKSGAVLVESKQFTASLKTSDDNTDEGDAEDTWTPGYVYNYTATINPNQIDSNMKEIKFTVTKVDDWKDHNDTDGDPITPAAQP